MNRLLSRREKDGHSHKRQKSRDKSRDKSSHQSDKKIRPFPSEIISLFKFEEKRKLDIDQSAKIQSMRETLAKAGYTNIGDEQLQYGLFSKHAEGNVEKALELMMLFQESVEGVIKPYNPNVEMKGAVNNRGVTCWLDSLLFAMFARLPSFEPILYTIYDDEPRRRLSTLIRLWVNMLRSGMLINTDVTCHLQEALVECGWEDGAKIQQQDTSEAFGFITETLQLPLLTLKMDLYHDGITDPKDDHKRVYERLLEVAIPPNPEDGKPIQLEDCLENYFNNRVEVKRMLERSNTAKMGRSNTVSSVRSVQSEKGGAIHIEVAELSSPNTPTSAYPPATPLSQTRSRAQSIIRRRLVSDDEQGETSTDPDNISTRNSVRKQSLRNEVIVPAWQFFNLIPWYTKSTIPNDASLAAHFSQARPVLGICLKRYSMTATGEALKNGTYIDIPLEIQLPHFVPDEMIEEEEPEMGNFKLSLQSVICHSGNAVNSGHYFSYIRVATQIADGDSASDRRLSNSSLPPGYPVDRWIRHNDLAVPRADYVDIAKALKEETPYLLFYQVQPIFDDFPQPASTTDLAADPPTYEAAIDIQLTESSPQVDRNPFFAIIRQQEQQAPQVQQDYFDATKEGTINSSAPSTRLSSEIERSRQSMTLLDERRGSTAFTETSISSAHSISAVDVTSAPVTPNEETTAQRLSRAASRFRKSGSKSRPTSSSGENRISATFSRLAARSKEQLNKMDIVPNKESIPPVPGNGDVAEHREPVTVTVEGAALKPPADAPSRKPSKRGRKQEKQEKRKSSDKARDDHHHHKKRTEPARDGKQIPERECMIM